MTQVMETASGTRAPVRILAVLVLLGLSLWTTPLSLELISMSRARARPVLATACPMPPGAFGSEIAAVSRDIGRRFHLAQSAAFSITRAAFRAAQVRGIDPTLVLAVAAVESKFRPHAVNQATGATGLMQVVPKWHQDRLVAVGGEPSLLLVAPNINVGAAILAEYVEAEDGNITGALGRYLGTAGGDHYVAHVRREMAHLSRVLKTI
jgi:soluble lytic murein transglycosylase-like protein